MELSGELWERDCWEDGGSCIRLLGCLWFGGARWLVGLYIYRSLSFARGVMVHVVQSRMVFESNPS